MPKPTNSPATPKQAGGKKATPHTSQTGQGEEGGVSRPDQRPEHTESISHQEKAHNEQIDRGETENPVADQDAGQESRNPPGRNSRGVSEDRDDEASGRHFKRELWDSQVFSDEGPPESSSRYVLLALGYLFNDAGMCWPTRADLAKITGLGERTIITHLDKVEAAGWISSDRNARVAGKRAIIYKALKGMLP